jgi:16S rRNA (uracil1498-N3)-methyltransferase
MGNEIFLSDGAGQSYLAVLEQTSTAGAVCLVTKEISGVPSLFPEITLVQGIPKGDKMDLIVQKGTELGLSRIIPLFSERVIVKLAEDKQTKRRERWQRIAVEAAKQCRRADLPEICFPQPWEQVLEEMPTDALALLPWEDETTESLKSFIKNNPSRPVIYYFIGPEGGFSPLEVEGARKQGVRTVSLGSRILRTETAGLAVATMLLYQWGDLGGA